MVTYNHERWIGEAIEGVLAQELSGDFELVIGEDASSDNTRAIVLDYQRRYPHLIRVIVSDHNVGAGKNHARVVAAARGELLAFCEGDDYWCHPRKLQEQAAILESDPGVAMVHADWIRSAADAKGVWRPNPRGSEHARLPASVLEGDLFPVFYFARILRTCTVMMRAEVLRAYRNDPLSTRAYRFEDTVINAYATSRWRVGYWPQLAAVYRESPRSLLRSGKASKIAFLRSCLDFDTVARARFADRGDYPPAYRWEVSVGLFIWALRARDAQAARDALADLRTHFGLVGFLASAWRTLQLRLPRPRARQLARGRGADA